VGSLGRQQIVVVAFRLEECLQGLFGPRTRKHFGEDHGPIAPLRLWHPPQHIWLRTFDINLQQINPRPSLDARRSSARTSTGQEHRPHSGRITAASRVDPEGTESISTPCCEVARRPRPRMRYPDTAHC
jgi:hypothetical protein